MKIPEILIIGNGTWHNTKKHKKTPSRFVLYYEIEYHKKNYGSTTINGVEYPIEKDTITFNRPGDIRGSSFNIDCEAETEFFYFITNNDEKNTNFEYLLENVPTYIHADEKTQKIWDRIIEYHSNKNDPLFELQTYLQLLSFLTYIAQKGRIAKQTPTPMSPNQQALFEAIRYMREHLTENLSVDDIATHIGYSRSHFNHLFKTYTQHTPHSYYTSLKISEAKYMLLNTNKNISQIADDLAFGKVSQFSNAFKKECHMTPGEFRKTRDVIFYNDL